MARRRAMKEHVLFDPVSETWWVDGYDIRRTLREVTQEEAQELIARDSPP